MIQRALLNPLYIITDILNQKVNEKSFPYIYTIFKNTYDVFDEAFPLTTTNMDNMTTLLHSLNEYKIVDNIDSPDFYIHSKNMLKDEIDKYRVKSLNRTKVKLDNLYIDNMIVRNELRKELDGLYDPFTIEMISDIFADDCNSCIKIITGGDNMLKWRFDDNGHIDFDFIEDRDKIEFVDNKKRREIDNLVFSNNDLDKDHGCKLKHPIDMDDPETEYNKLLLTYKKSLTVLLCSIHGLKYKRYIPKETIFGINRNKLSLNKIIRKSPWFSNIKDDKSIKNFNVRFITILMYMVIDKIDTITELCYEFNKDVSILEYDAKIEYLSYTMTRLSSIIDSLSYGKPYDDDLIYFNEIFTILERDSVERIEVIREQSDILSHRLRKFSRESNDISMDTLLKLAYLVITPKGKVRNKVQFFENYKFSNKQLTRELVTELGESILKNRKKHDIPLLYNIYVSAKPNLICKWKDVNKNIPLKCGVIALNYLKFVLNDNNISRQIDKLLIN